MYPHAQKKEQPEKLKKNIAKKKSKEEENPQKLNVIYEEDIAERYY